MMYKNITAAKALAICIVVVISLFIVCGVGLLFAGTLDNLVAGVCMFALAVWIAIFAISVRDLFRSVAIEKNELIIRTIFSKKGTRYAFSDIEEIALAKFNLLVIQLKSGDIITILNANNGIEVVQKVHAKIPVSKPSKPIETLKTEFMQSRKSLKKWIISVLVAVALLIVSLVLAIVLTEGKEVDLFNSSDWFYFSIFMSFFAVLLCSLLLMLHPLIVALWDKNGRLWAWRRGACFNDNKSVLAYPLKVLLDIDGVTRYSYGKDTVDGREIEVASLEKFMFKDGEIQKIIHLCQDSDAEFFRERISVDKTLRCINDMID